jgi:hypothetical protein
MRNEKQPAANDGLTGQRRRLPKPDRVRALELLAAAAFVCTMPIAARADEVPKQFHGRWCVTEPTEQTKDRDVYTRDRRRECSPDNNTGLLVTANGKVGHFIKCLTLVTLYLPKYQQHVVTFACVPPKESGDKPWIENRSMWLDEQGRLNLGDADKGIQP